MRLSGKAGAVLLVRCEDPTDVDFCVDCAKALSDARPTRMMIMLKTIEIIGEIYATRIVSSLRREKTDVDSPCPE